MNSSPASAMSSTAATTSPSISHSSSLRSLATLTHPQPLPIQSTVSTPIIPTLTPKPTTHHPTAMFTPFPNLPPELRLQIWELAANTPRNVDLWATNAMFMTNSDSNSSRRRQWGVRYYSLATVPSILHVCSEARAVGLKFYELGFDGEEEEAVEEVPSVAGIWINWTVDTIVPMELWRWSGEALGELFGSSGAGKQQRGLGGKIKHLALNAEIGDWRCAWFLGLRFESLMLYYRERALGLAGVLELRGGGAGGGAGVVFEALDSESERSSGVVNREMRQLRRAKEYVYWEFAELEALQARLKEEEEIWGVDASGSGIGSGPGGETSQDGSVGFGFGFGAGVGAGAGTRVLQSPLFSDAFSRSAGWLDAELEVAFKRKMPRIEFMKMSIGSEL